MVICCGRLCRFGCRGPSRLSVTGMISPWDGFNAFAGAFRLPAPWFLHGVRPTVDDVWIHRVIPARSVVIQNILQNVLRSHGIDVAARLERTLSEWKDDLRH